MPTASASASAAARRVGAVSDGPEHGPADGQRAAVASVSRGPGGSRLARELQYGQHKRH